MEQADTSGPLEEIEFWSTRCEDLSGLTTQLDKPGVLRVCKILEKAKSSYLKQFNKLARLIQVGLCISKSVNMNFTTLYSLCLEGLILMVAFNVGSTILCRRAFFRF